MSAPDQKPPSTAADDAAMLSLEDELLSAMAEIEGMTGKTPEVAETPPAAAEDASAANPAEPTPKGLKFKIGKKGDAKAGGGAAKPAAKVAPDPVARSTPLDAITGAMPRVSMLKRGIRMLDATLEVTSAPMRFVPPKVRRVVGAVSLATIVVSAASAVLLPIVLPYRDAITFLADRRAALESEQHAAADHGEEAAGDGHGGGTKDAHGDKKADSHGAKKDDGHGAKKADAHGDKKADAHGAKKDDGHGAKKPEKKADAHGGKDDGHGAKPVKKEDKKKADKKDDAHGAKSDGHGAKDDGHGGGAKKAEKKPASKDAKKKDSKKKDAKKDDGHGGH